MKIFSSWLVLLALCTGLATLQAQDIVTLASQKEDLSTLMVAVKKAGLVETLQGAGPFTVFAPKNSGFNDLHKIRMNTLMQAGMENHLKELLSFHVVQGRYTEADLRKAIEENGGRATLQSVAGFPISAVIDGSKIELVDHLGEKSEVEMADIQASNGIIHIVDEVMIPKEMEARGQKAGYMDEMSERGVAKTDVAAKAQPGNAQVTVKTEADKEMTRQDKAVMAEGQAKVKNIVEMAQSLQNTQMAYQAIQAAGLTEKLQSGGKDAWTIFLPTDDALNKVPQTQRDAWMQSGNQEKLSKLLMYHVVDDRETFTEMMDKTDWGKDQGQNSFNTKAGERLFVMQKEGEIWLKDKSGNKARVTAANIPASNGVIYLIDAVMVPEEGMMYQKEGDMNKNKPMDKPIDKSKSKDKSMKQDQPMEKGKSGSSSKQ